MSPEDFQELVNEASRLYNHGEGLAVPLAAADVVRRFVTTDDDSDLAVEQRRAICSALGSRGGRKKARIVPRRTQKEREGRSLEEFADRSLPTDQPPKPSTSILEQQGAQMKLFEKQGRHI